MTIANYSELQSAVLAWSHRQNLAARVPEFIALAEMRLGAILKARTQNASTTIPIEAGNKVAALPPSLAGIQALSIAEVSPSIDYLSPAQFADKYSAIYKGAPRHYTVIGDLIFFGPTPDAAYTVDCVLNTSSTPLSDTAPTNAVLQKWPNVYLFASLVELSDFTKDQAANAKWEGRLQEAIAGINQLDWHAGGSLRVRSDVRM